MTSPEIVRIERVARGTESGPATIEHAVLLASAGSGKTWQLATRFLQLTALGVDPSTILASTFTRAAAGEIRDRVLERCAEAALDPAKAAALAVDLGVNLGREGQGVATLLQRLVAAWPRLQVRTLDSLMFAIVSAHGFELGIEPSTKLADETQMRSMRDEATRRLLERFGEEKAVSLLKELTAGRSDSNVARSIDSVVGALHGLWREAPEDAWNTIHPGAPRRDDELAAAIERVRRVRGIGNKSIEKGVQSFIDLAQAGRWEALIGKGLGLKLAQGETSYYARLLADDIVVAGGLVAEHAKSVVLDGIRRQTLAACELITGWSALLREIQRERRLVGFDDLPWLLSKAEALGSLERIAYRLDARLHHMLLDEMQDTSAPQWAALRPFAEELYRQRAGERSFFCVGDLKQSIYGWRGATPEILASLPGTIGIDPTNLALTRRCGPTVVAAVNQVFGAVGTMPCLEEVRGAARRFEAFFVPHETSRSEPGHVELRCAPAADETDDEAPKQAALRLRAAAETVARLHRAAPKATIGVLVRTNAVVNRMLYLLGPGGPGGPEGPRRNGLPVAGRGGAPLTDSPAVEAVLDLLRLSIHPGHTVAAFNVACSPLGAIVGLSRGAGPNESTDAASRARVAGAVRRRVARDGLVPTIGAWVSALASSADARERRRLVQLAELATQVPVDGSASSGPVDPIDEFIQRVETTNVADESTAPIQVMTVHQSKGIEFDLVVLPELETPLVRSQGQVAAWDRATPGGPPTAIIRWVDENRRVALPGQLAAIFDRHRDRLALESMCLLYVALTRARDGLYAVVDPPRKGRSDKTSAGVLRQALAPGVEETPGEAIFAAGEEVAMLARLAGRDGERARVGGHARVPEPSRGPIELRPTHGMSRIGAASPSTSADVPEFDRDIVAPLQADPARRRGAIDRGTALHTMLERCEWIESFEDDDAALVAAVRRAVPLRDAAWAAVQVAELRSRLGRGALAEALRRGDRVDVEVRREHRFARLTGDGLQVGSIDRLMIARRNGKVTAAQIVDFKTGGVADAPAEVGPRGVEALAERYRPQMAAYRAAVAEQFELAPESIVAQLVFVDLDLAIAVAP